MGRRARDDGDDDVARRGGEMAIEERKTARSSNGRGAARPSPLGWCGEQTGGRLSIGGGGGGFRATETPNPSRTNGPRRRT